MPKQHQHLSVTWDQVHAFRLARHHLSERASTRDLLSVACDMTGAQAQLSSAAQISFWSRVGSLQVKDVEQAVDKRKLVKASCMRRTLFLLPANIWRSSFEAPHGAQKKGSACVAETDRDAHMGGLGQRPYRLGSESSEIVGENRQGG